MFMTFTLIFVKKIYMWFEIIVVFVKYFVIEFNKILRSTMHEALF